MPAPMKAVSPQYPKFAFHWKRGSIAVPRSHQVGPGALAWTGTIDAPAAIARVAAPTRTRTAQRARCRGEET